WTFTGWSSLPLETSVMVNVCGPPSKSTASSWSELGASDSLMSKVMSCHLNVEVDAVGLGHVGDSGFVVGDDLCDVLLERDAGGGDGVLPLRLGSDALDIERHPTDVGHEVDPLAAGDQQPGLELRHVVSGHLVSEDGAN